MFGKFSRLRVKYGLDQDQGNQNLLIFYSLNINIMQTSRIFSINSNAVSKNLVAC